MNTHLFLKSRMVDGSGFKLITSLGPFYGSKNCLEEMLRSFKDPMLEPEVILKSG